MDIVRFIAERKIDAAMDEGLFDNLPSHGRIDCSLQGEAFIASWFRAHYGNDTTMDRKNEESREREESVRKREEVTEEPDQTTGGTGTLPQGGVPNPGFTARGG